MSRRNWLVGMTTLITFVLGILWGILIKTGIWSIWLPAIVFLILIVLVFLIKALLERMIGFYVPMHASGFYFLIGVILLGGAISSFNLYICLIAIFFLLFALKLEY